MPRLLPSLSIPVHYLLSLSFEAILSELLLLQLLNKLTASLPSDSLVGLLWYLRAGIRIPMCEQCISLVTNVGKHRDIIAH
jgi:hypothetical protein